MRTMARNRVWLVAFGLVGTAAVSGCSPERSSAPGVSSRAQALGIGGGNIPVPVVPCASDLPGQSGTCEAETRPLDWDGSYAELLAADALAQCALRERVGADGNVGFERPFYDRLHGLMTTASCPLIVTTPPTATPSYTADEALYFQW